MRKTLFVIAAGLAVRFNGKPKHLAEVNKVTVLDNTLSLARRWYNDIYVVVNCQVDPNVFKTTQTIALAHGAYINEIPSGRGDADAVYRSLVKANVDDGNVSICWGDAWFKNDAVFERASKSLESDKSKITFEALCAVEDNPYGWFELEDDAVTIRRATFANDRSCAAVKVGVVHDQCFFNINVKNFKQLFEAYERSILAEKTEIENDIASHYCSLYKFKLNYEVSWYKMINWALMSQQSNSDFHRRRSIVNMLVQPCAMSFNTEEDLMEIEKNV